MALPLFLTSRRRGILEMLIDDRSGKLLFFYYQRPMSDEDPLYGYRAYGEAPDAEKLQGAALEDLRKQSDNMENFCREYYGFTLSEEECYADEAGAGARGDGIFGAEGNRIPHMFEPGSRWNHVYLGLVDGGDSER